MGVSPVWLKPASPAEMDGGRSTLVGPSDEIAPAGGAAF
jgi:hypothetical protein